MPISSISGNVGNSSAIEYITKFAGHSWYVDAAVASSGNGIEPAYAFKTIGEAITAASSGDRIVVKSGTYTETGLDLDKDSVELWCETGVTISPATGTALTISGNYCTVSGRLRITPAAGATGLLVSGNECVIGNVKVLKGAIGIQVTGTGVILDNCAVGFPTTIAYDLQGEQGRLHRCKTVGNASTYGYRVSNSASTGVLDSCTSMGHATAGYYIDSGSSEWTILRCSSGADEGRWVDVDNANVWSNFTFDNEVYHTTTFDGSGPGTDNLFKVTGAVEIDYIYGDVDVVLSADVDDIYLDLWDGTNSKEITDSSGTDTDSAPVGSLFIKTEKASSAITLLKADQCRVEENTSFQRPRIPFIANQKADTDTYIRVVYSGVATSGAIHWHCRWIPLTEDGFVEAA